MAFGLGLRGTSAVGGAVHGLVEGLRHREDRQARRLAERRAGRMEAMEQEKFDFLKGTTEAEQARASTLFEETREKNAMDRLKTIAEESVGPDWSSLTPAQQRPVYERMFTAIQREDTPPTEAARNAGLVASVIKEMERTKREARDLERQKAAPTPQGKDGTVAATTKATLYKLGQAKAAITSLEKLWQETEPSESGVLAKAEGVARSIGVPIGVAPKTQLYKDTSGGLMALVSKSFGESGVLTDADIIRATKLSARVGDSAQIARRKFDTLLKLVAHGENNAMRLEQGLDPAPFDWGSVPQSSEGAGDDPGGFRNLDFGTGQP